MIVCRKDLPTQKNCCKIFFCGLYSVLIYGYGCIAQLVEQLTLNQWVWGSNPHAPTITGPFLTEGLFFVYKVVLKDRQAGRCGHPAAVCPFSARRKII